MKSVLLLGGLLLVIGIVWRGVAHHRERERLRIALTSPDANVRALAFRRISRTGLTPFATTLLELTQTLDDPVRTGELAWLVASMQWEPARDPRIAQLRIWADHYYREHRRAPVSPPRAVVDEGSGLTEHPSALAALASVPLTGPMAVHADAAPSEPEALSPSPAVEPVRARADGAWRPAAPVAAAAPAGGPDGVRDTPVPIPRSALAGAPMPRSQGARLPSIPPVEPVGPPSFVLELERVLGQRVLRVRYEPAALLGSAH